MLSELSMGLFCLLLGLPVEKEMMSDDLINENAPDYKKKPVSCLNNIQI